jgi:hypothetical protein
MKKLYECFLEPDKQNDMIIEPQENNESSLLQRYIFGRTVDGVMSHPHSKFFMKMALLDRDRNRHQPESPEYQAYSQHMDELSDNFEDDNNTAEIAKKSIDLLMPSDVSEDNEDDILEMINVFDDLHSIILSENDIVLRELLTETPGEWTAKGAGIINRFVSEKLPKLTSKGIDLHTERQVARKKAKSMKKYKSGIPLDSDEMQKIMDDHAGHFYTQGIDVNTAQGKEKAKKLPEVQNAIKQAISDKTKKHIEDQEIKTRIRHHKKYKEPTKAYIQKATDDITRPIVQHAKGISSAAKVIGIAGVAKLLGAHLPGTAAAVAVGAAKDAIRKAGHNPNDATKGGIRKRASRYVRDVLSDVGADYINPDRIKHGELTSRVVDFIKAHPVGTTAGALAAGYMASKALNDRDD